LEASVFWLQSTIGGDSSKEVVVTVTDIGLIPTASQR